jgi:hypothetical protein
LASARRAKGNIKMSINYYPNGIEINQGDRDLSACIVITNNIPKYQVGIGVGYGEGPGGSYLNWADITLTLEEAQVFRDWLNDTINRRRFAPKGVQFPLAITQPAAGSTMSTAASPRKDPNEQP